MTFFLRKDTNYYYDIDACCTDALIRDAREYVDKYRYYYLDECRRDCADLLTEEEFEDDDALIDSDVLYDWIIDNCVNIFLKEECVELKEKC